MGDHVKLQVAILVVVAACSHAQPAAVAVVPRAKIKLAVIPADADLFPQVAKAVTDSMTSARIGGIDETQVAKIPLADVQVLIECNDPTALCYAAVGKSMFANRLLFAQLAAGTQPRQLRMTVTLFDVDTQAAKRTAEKLFASEADAAAGTADLVAEAIKP